MLQFSAVFSKKCGFIVCSYYEPIYHDRIILVTGKNDLYLI